MRGVSEKSAGALSPKYPYEGEALVFPKHEEEEETGRPMGPLHLDKCPALLGMLVECVFEGVECGPGAYTGEWLVPEVSFAWQRCATSHAEPRWTLVL